MRGFDADNCSEHKSSHSWQRLERTARAACSSSLCGRAPGATATEEQKSGNCGCHRDQGADDAASNAAIVARRT